jgi:hypothetical protein
MGTVGKPISDAMGEEDRERHRASQIAGTVVRLSREITDRRSMMNLLFQPVFVKDWPTSPADPTVFPRGTQLGPTGRKNEQMEHGAKPNSLLGLK